MEAEADALLPTTCDVLINSCLHEGIVRYIIFARLNKCILTHFSSWVSCRDEASRDTHTLIRERELYKIHDTRRRLIWWHSDADSGEMSAYRRERSSSLAWGGLPVGTTGGFDLVSKPSEPLAARWLFVRTTVWITLRVALAASKWCSWQWARTGLQSGVSGSSSAYISERTGEEEQRAKMRSPPAGSLRAAISGMSKVWNSVWSPVHCSHFPRFVCKWWREAGTEKLLLKAVLHKKKKDSFVNLTKAQKTKARK